MMIYNYIKQVLIYKGYYDFVCKTYIKLNKNEYLNEDIIGMTVYTDNKELGIVKRIENHNGNEILFVHGEKDVLIPYNFDIIENVNLEKKEIIVKNIPGLFD